MLLHDNQSELVFENGIDARFPYNEKIAAADLIEQGLSISLNAAFCVLEEICRPPQSTAVSPERLIELTELWASYVDHKLCKPVLQCALALIDRKHVPTTKAVETMEYIGQFDGQRAALNIAYFAGDCSTVEKDNLLVEVDQKIRQRWEAKGV